MGTENLHHKRKQRKPASFQRGTSKRKPYDTVLIICEGEKTEPCYLNALCQELKISPNITIEGIGCDPLSVVKHAEQLYKKNKHDRVYCIFDRDQHPSFLSAIDKIEKKRSIPIKAIISVPCFEYWPLLHFKESARPYNNAEEILSELKIYLPSYHKGCNDLFEQTKDKLLEAIKRAKRLCKQRDEHGSDNPSTNMHELIEYLMNIKK